MQPHDMKGRKPDDDNPDPSSFHTRLLLLVIAILGGAFANQILWRILYVPRRARRRQSERVLLLRAPRTPGFHPQLGWG